MSSEVDVFCGVAGFSVDAEEISAVVACLRENAPWAFPAGTLSVAFLGDEEICEMHEAFLDDPSKTDVITFPGDEIFTHPKTRLAGNAAPESENASDKDIAAGDAFAGEICVCVDQAQRMAKELNVPEADELLLYLVHGWLHLAGLDDIEEADRREMRAAEAFALNLLREKNLAPLKTPVFP